MPSCFPSIEHFHLTKKYKSFWTIPYAFEKQLSPSRPGGLHWRVINPLLGMEETLASEFLLPWHSLLPSLPGDPSMAWDISQASSLSEACSKTSSSGSCSNSLWSLLCLTVLVASWCSSVISQPSNSRSRLRKLNYSAWCLACGLWRNFCEWQNYSTCSFKNILHCVRKTIVNQMDQKRCKEKNSTENLVRDSLVCWSWLAFLPHR